MKITKSELKQLIKEEATKYKKNLVLESRKAEILKEMNDLYETEEELDEILGMFKKADPAQKREEFKKMILSHPNFKKVPAYWASKSGKDTNHLLEKLVDLFVQVGGQPKAVVYDAAKDMFFDKTKYTGNAPGMQGAAE